MFLRTWLHDGPRHLPRQGAGKSRCGTAYDFEPNQHEWNAQGHNEVRRLCTWRFDKPSIMVHIHLYRTWARANCPMRCERHAVWRRCGRTGFSIACLRISGPCGSRLGPRGGETHTQRCTCTIEVSHSLTAANVDNRNEANAQVLGGNAHPPPPGKGEGRG